MRGIDIGALPGQHGRVSVSRAALVTGCSSGIGRASALALAAAGFPTYATARRVDTLQELADAGCTVLACDVTDEASMAAAVARVQDEHASVGVLVNNAGYAQYGPLEEVGWIAGGRSSRRTCSA